MAEENKTVETTKEKVEVNLDEIFNGAPGGDSITLPEEESKKPNVFSRKPEVDMSFVDEPTKETTEKEEEVKEEEVVETTDTKKTEKVSKEQIDEIFGDNTEEEKVVEEAPKKRGRKAIEGVADVFKKLIDDEKILAFDDGKDLEEYSAKDWQE